MRIALVHDDFTQFGGGEKVFLAIKEIFPTAPIYTSMVTGEWAQRLRQKSEGRRQIVTSFMQRFPFKKRLERVYFPFYPLAFESLDLSDFDLVISSSSRFAHGVITKPETLHICYMHSPGRMFWEGAGYFGERSKLGTLLSPALSYLRLWDFSAAQRVDHFIANSKNTAERITKYYHREAKVLYPFVDLGRFTPQTANNGDYFLVVTRLAQWKRVNIAVGAANQAGFRLKVVGDGPDRKRLEKMAGKRVELLGNVSDEELVRLYNGCKAFVMTQKEDFGITSLEAQASGKPVIAYGTGGALETVIEGKTGVFFEEQTSESLIEALKRAERISWDPQLMRKNALRFGRERFKREFEEFVDKKVGEWRSTK